MQDLYFRHENFRPMQQNFIADVWGALERKSNIVACVPTGTGKTDAAISTALTFASHNNLNVFFLTPKISQHRIAVESIKGIVSKYSLDVKGVDFVGRENMCDEELFGCNFHNKKECKSYCKFKQDSEGKNISHSNSIDNFDDAIRQCQKKGHCPYESSLSKARHSRIVVADFFHLFLPPVRSVFLGKLGKKLEDSIVIVDEAHNLNPRVLDSLSSILSFNLISRAEKEAIKVESSECFRELQNLKESLKKLNFEKLRDFRECFVSRDVLQWENWNFFEEVGKKYMEREKMKRSSLVSIASFFQRWYSNDNQYARILSLKEGLKVNCLESFDVAEAVNSSYATIAMSGTFLPLKMHAEILGFDLKRTLLREYDSPFPKENKRFFIVEGVTTKFERRTEAEYEKIAIMLQKLIDQYQIGLVFYFPSYSVLKSVLSFLDVFGKNVLIQREDAYARDTGELIGQFKKNPGILCAVLGGSVSEGVDFNNKEISCIAIVGLPLQEVTLDVQAQIDYYQKKFGSGWDYAYVFPAINKVMQASGRGIRSETDKCDIYLLDERYSWQNYLKCFPNGFNPKYLNAIA